jgi:hypothetical protein
MAKALPLAEQVKIAGELAFKCETFYATWVAIAGRDSRSKYRDALATHPEILMSIQSANMFALVCGLHSLFEKDRRHVTLPALSERADDIAAKQLAQTAEIARKVAKLRHTQYAHRSGKLTTSAAFKEADLTPNNLKWLAMKASAIARIIAHHLELPPPPEAIGARAAVANLLDAVARDTLATWAGAPDPFASSH